MLFATAFPAIPFSLLASKCPFAAGARGCTWVALGGLIYLFLKPRQAGLPAKKILFALLGFLLLFAVDGINSTLGFFQGVTGLYNPQNWLRLITGSGMGIAIAAMLVPVFHSAAWLDSLPSATLSTWRSFLPLVAIAGVLDILVLSQLSIFLLPLAILSSLTVILILTLVYSVLWLLIWKKDGTIQNLSAALSLASDRFRDCVVADDPDGCFAFCDHRYLGGIHIIIIYINNLGGLFC